MKKFYTLLVAAIVALTASAKVKVTAENIATEIKDGAVIALANGQIGFGGKAWFAGIETVTTESPDVIPAEALMQLIASEAEGEYYIQRLSDGKYVGRDAKVSDAGNWVDILMVDTPEEAITHTFNVVSAANANVFGPQDEVVSLVSADLLFGEEGSQTNYNGLMFGGNTTLPNKFGSAGNGPWKVWCVYTLSEYEADLLLNPTPVVTKITAATVGSLIKDGAVIALANGQIGFGGKAWFAGVETVLSEEAEKAPAEALMMLEAAEAEGEYYIKTYADGKYVGRDTKVSDAGNWVDIVMVDTKEEAITHTFNVVTAANANVYGPQDEVVSLVSADLLFGEEGSQTNYNGLMFGGNTTLPNKFGSAGNGPWKVWCIWAFENAAAIENVVNPPVPEERGEWTVTVAQGVAFGKAPVVATADMGVAVANGANVVKYRFDGTEEWSKTLDGTVAGLAEDAKGNLIIAANGAEDATLEVLAANGNSKATQSLSMTVAGLSEAEGKIIVWGMEEGAGVVLANDVTLQNSSEVANITPAEGAAITSLAATVGENNVCIAVTSNGEIHVNAGSLVKTYSAGLTIVNIFGDNVYANNYASATAITADGIAIDGEVIYVGGSFAGTNPVNTALAAVGNSDLYIARFEKVNGGRWGKSAVASAYNEVLEGASEVATLLSVADGEIVLSGYIAGIDQICGAVLITDFAETEMSGVEPGILVGASGDVAAVYTAEGDLILTSEGCELTELPDIATGVAAAKTVSQTAVFDLLGRRVSTPAKGIYIIGSKKVVIK